MAGKIHSGGTVHFRLRGDRRVVRRDSAKTLTVRSLERGITVKRKGNPKEATIEAHGLIDGQPTSRHFRLHIYDDVVTQDYLSEESLRKTTERWELADNLGSHLGVRKWMPGTRYHYADTCGVVIERDAVLSRITGTIYRGTERISSNALFNRLQVGPDPVIRQKVGSIGRALALLAALVIPASAEPQRSSQNAC